MELVVERQRPGGVRLADHRIERDVVEREVGGFSRRRRAHLRQRRIDLQNLAQIAGQVRRGFRQRDQSVGAGDDADAVPALMTIGNDLHDALPRCFSLQYHTEKPVDCDIRETNHARRDLPRRTQIATDGIPRSGAGPARRRRGDKGVRHVRQRSEILSRHGRRRLAGLRQSERPGDRRPRAVWRRRRTRQRGRRAHGPDR